MQAHGDGFGGLLAVGGTGLTNDVVERGAHDVALGVRPGPGAVGDAWLTVLRVDRIHDHVCGVGYA